MMRVYLCCVSCIEKLKHGHPMTPFKFESIDGWCGWCRESVNGRAVLMAAREPT